MSAAEYYDSTGAPSTGSAGSSASMRAEFDLIQTGFGKLPDLAGNGSRAVVINSGGTAMSVTAAALALAIAFTTAGSGDITLTGAGSTNVTLPTTGTLATLAGVEELDNKTLDSSVGKGTWTASGTWTLPAFTLGGTVSSNGQSFSGTIANLGTVTTVDINGGTVDGAVIGGASAANGTFTTLQVNTNANPDADDGAGLGTGLLGWSDLFLASGGLINWANGNAVLTHSSGVLTVSTGDLRVTTAGSNAASAVTVGGSQTLTSKTLTSPTITTSPTAAGATWTNLGTVTTADINGGTIDGTIIGGSSVAAGSFAAVVSTTLTASGLITANAGISVPTGFNVTGAGTAQVTGFATVSATTLAGTLSTASQPNITGVGTITVGVWTGTDIAVADGGTGASTAANARTNLGLVINTDVQAYDATLLALAGLTIAADSLSIGTGADAFTQVTFAANTFPAKASAGALVAKAITDFGLSLVDDADAAAGRATLAAAGSGAVTASGITMATARVLGRTTASTGAIEEISIGSGLSLAAGVLSSTAGGGSVTSVDVSGGTTGLTTSGGPIVGAGTITLAGTLAVANGGTGSTTAANARTALGLAIGTDVQAYDATLASIAGLGTGADKLAYTTGVDTWAETALTAFGRSLIDDAAASNARTTLGLVIGTDVQAQDAELAAIAGLVSAADRLPYFTGSGTASLATFTAFGRSLVDDADAAAGRTTLGVVIGTDVQAYDGTLAAFAALTIAANSLTIGTGADAFSQTTFAANTFPARASTGNLVAKTITDFGLSLVDDTDASAGRTTLGLGALATLAAVDTAQIQDDAVTFAKFQNITTARVLGRTTGGSGNVEELSAGTNMTISTNAISVIDNPTFASVTISTAASKIIPGATSISLRNNADSADNLLISNAGSVTVRADLTIGGASIPQNSKSAAYTTVLADANKHILHPSSDNNARTFTIDSNANVAYEIGTAITFVNEINTVTIAITADTLTLAGSGATGSRTLQANGMATALKVAATKWIISGTNLA